MANFSLLKQKLSGDDELDNIAAQQSVQQQNVLPTERQPPMQAIADPSSEALEHPLISPEDLIANAAAVPLARAGVSAAADVARPAFQGIKSLVTDEAGSFDPSKAKSLITNGIMGAEKSAIGNMNETTNSALEAADPDMLLNQQLLTGKAPPTTEDVAKAQQTASRAIDMADRYRKQKALRKLSGR